MGPEGGYDDYFGAGCNELSKRFGEGKVPADEEANRANWGMHCCVRHRG